MTHWPGLHSMILVSGSSVVSVRNAFPSTLPLRTTDASRLIGNRGFVTLVESENAGATRSTRRSLGATGSLSRPAAAMWAPVGWGTGVATLSLHARTARAVADLPAAVVPPSAAAIRTAAEPAPIRPASQAPTGPGSLMTSAPG